METLSLSQARNLMLESQRLNDTNSDPLKVIEHLGYVQLDTISVVERAHHHVIWSRSPEYSGDHLDQLMKQRKIYEYWSHAASILPMKEYRYSLALKKEFRSRTSSWFPRDKKLMNQVLNRIKSEGPLQSKDFKREIKQTGSGWWDWKPAKKALERLFLDGDLEVTRRDAFRKVYDLPENVIPEAVDTSHPSKWEYYRYLIHRTLRHHGFASVDEIGYLSKKGEKTGIKQVVDNLIEDGEIIKIQIKGLDEDYYSLPSKLETKPRTNSRIHILSPFDNMVIQREKLESLFNFNYQIECYVPQAKRKFGYFCLPIFKGATAIGRMDCKADRKSRVLEVKSLHSEGARDIKPLIAKKLSAFAVFNGCDQVLWQN